MQLENKSTIVTGGASGVGKAIAERFAREGARVTVADINEQGVGQVVESIQSRRGMATPFVLDISIPDEVNAMIETAAEQHARLDVIVNSAAIARVQKVLDITIENWNELLAINLTGVFLCAQAAARFMQVHGGGGRIINISSVNGQRAITGRGTYSVAKGGVEMLSRIMAAELGDYGITVNSIAPAPVDTPMIKKMHDATTRAQWHRVLPIKRYAQPGEVAHAAVFLASDESAYITGHTLNVDGGFNAAGLLLV
jgi:NAD(P)-dependent dehydrogenase (short-subunit alcohol dehydrogenase family)